MYKFIRYLSLLVLLCGWFGMSTAYAESDHSSEIKYRHTEWTN